jgi:protein-S-isoprenylcysteine O-methyltransferase Ste14
VTNELLFRVFFSILWIIFFANLVWVRYSSSKYAGKQPAERAIQPEGRLCIVALALPAAFWYAGILLYALLPGWISFLSIPLPDWFRLIMVVAGLLSISFALWGYRALGRSWVHALEPSKFQQREYGMLVTTGPYHYVRNPIYLGAFSLFVAQGLVAGNWLVLLPPLAIIPIFYGQVPKEELMLIDRFGDEYREYMKRTRRIIPKFRRERPTQQ